MGIMHLDRFFRDLILLRLYLTLAEDLTKKSQHPGEHSPRHHAHRENIYSKLLHLLLLETTNIKLFANIKEVDEKGYPSIYY